MKNITLLSLVAASLLFVACGEKTKEAATDAKEAITEAVKTDTESAYESTKKALEEAASAAKVEAQELADAAAKKAAELQVIAEKKAAEAAESVKETASEVSAALTPENVAGKAAYAKCAGCHGADGKTKALGKSAVVAGQSVADLVAALTEYKAGTKNVSGMGALMKGQVASMSEDDIKAVSEYMSGL